MSETEVYPILERLLLRMGYERVYITHGPLEIGRDLVFLERSRLGEEEWRGIQLKNSVKGALSRPANLRTLVSQCDAALENPWSTPDRREVRLSEIWVVLLSSLDEGAKLTISHEFLYKSRVRIIDGPKLAELMRKYLPDEMPDPSKSISDYLDALADFGNSLDDYVGRRFDQRFGLSEVYVRPDAVVNFLSTEGIEQLGAQTVREDLSGLENWLSMLVRLGATGLPAALHFKLASTLSRLQGLFASAASLSSYEDSSRKARASLRSLCSLIDFGFAAEGSVLGLVSSRYRYTAKISREQIEEIRDDLAALVNSQVLLDIHKGVLKGTEGRPLRIRGALTLDGAREVCSHPLLVPLVELEWWSRNPDPSVFGSDHIKKTEARAKRALTRLWKVYRTSLDSEDPLFDLSLATAKLLAERAESEARLSADYWEKKEQKLIQEVQDIRGYLHGLRSLVLKNLNRLQKAMDYQELDASALGSDDLVELQALSSLAAQLWKLPASCIRELRIDDALAFTTQAGSLIVEADLGLGKTTLLKRIAEEAARERLEDSSLPMPFFVRLARVSRTVRVDDAALKAASEAEGDKIVSIGSEGAGRLWLLDGFDEVQDDRLRESILKWVLEKGKENAKILLTSRPHALPAFFPRFVRLRLERFSSERIKELVRGFPWSRDGEDKEFLSLLDDSKDLYALAEVPLLLTLLLLVARSAGVARIPTARKELYELITDLFLGEWDLSKGVSKVRAIHSDAMRKRVLEKVSYGLYARGHRFFSLDTFVEEFDRIWVDKVESIEIALRFFGELVRDCVIVPQSREVFGFFHLSMQEFLAAKELASDIDARRVVRAVREFCRSGGWWEEVLVFYAAMKGDIAVLLGDLHEKGLPPMPGGRIDRNFLRLVRRMLEEAVFTDPKEVKARAGIAKTLEHLDYGGKRAVWRRMQGTPR